MGGAQSLNHSKVDIPGRVGLTHSIYSDAAPPPQNVLMWTHIRVYDNAVIINALRMLYFGHWLGMEAKPQAKKHGAVTEGRQQQAMNTNMWLTYDK